MLILYHMVLHLLLSLKLDHVHLVQPLPYNPYSVAPYYLVLQLVALQFTFLCTSRFVFFIITAIFSLSGSLHVDKVNKLVRQHPLCVT